uniref:Uncharacterized protein n=1 Tax=Salix viminalis TaxID=40686 RepID=A0A6N2L7W7_SALVM
MRIKPRFCLLRICLRILIGERKELLALLKTRVHVGHAGVLALQELWKVHISLLLESLLASASSSFVIQKNHDRATLGAMGG